MSGSRHRIGIKTLGPQTHPNQPVTKLISHQAGGSTRIESIAIRNDRGDSRRKLEPLLLRRIRWPGSFTERYLPSVASQEVEGIV